MKIKFYLIIILFLIFGCENEKNKIFIEKIGYVRTINDFEYTLEVGSGFDGDSEIYNLLINGNNEAAFGPYKNEKAKVKGLTNTVWTGYRYEIDLYVVSIEPAE